MTSAVEHVPGPSDAAEDGEAPRLTEPGGEASFLDAVRTLVHGERIAEQRADSDAWESTEGLSRSEAAASEAREGEPEAQSLPEREPDPYDDTATAGSGEDGDSWLPGHWVPESAPPSSGRRRRSPVSEKSPKSLKSSRRRRRGRTVDQAALRGVPGVEDQMVGRQHAPEVEPDEPVAARPELGPPPEPLMSRRARRRATSRDDARAASAEEAKAEQDPVDPEGEPAGSRAERKQAKARARAERAAAATQLKQKRRASRQEAAAERAATKERAAERRRTAKEQAVLDRAAALAAKAQAKIDRDAAKARARAERERATAGEPLVEPVADDTMSELVAPQDARAFQEPADLTRKGDRRAARAEARAAREAAETVTKAKRETLDARAEAERRADEARAQAEREAAEEQARAERDDAAEQARLDREAAATAKAEAKAAREAAQARERWDRETAAARSKAEQRAAKAALARDEAESEAAAAHARADQLAERVLADVARVKARADERAQKAAGKAAARVARATAKAEASVARTTLRAQRKADRAAARARNKVDGAAAKAEGKVGKASAQAQVKADNAAARAQHAGELAARAASGGLAGEPSADSKRRESLADYIARIESQRRSAGKRRRRSATVKVSLVAVVGVVAVCAVLPWAAPSVRERIADLVPGGTSASPRVEDPPVDPPTRSVAPEVITEQAEGLAGVRLESAGPPREVSVPRLHVESEVIPISGQSGTLLPPSDPQQLGWWREGQPAGAQYGSAVVTGHTVHTGGGALDNLDKLVVGDTVRVRTDAGWIRYVVQRTRIYSTEELAEEAEEVFTHGGEGRLVLITCDDWNGEYYESNAIVFAAPVRDEPFSADAS